jgi:hypothetical protein
MEADTISRPAAPGYSPLTEIKAPGWHSLVAWDILCNNLSSGLFLVAAIAELTDPARFTRVAIVAYPVALAFLIVDLVLLVVDLGDPARFHHMLRVFKLSSPMSLGVWSLSAFALLLTVAMVLGFVPGDAPALEWARRVVLILGLVPALASATYKGVLFSTSSQPGWKDARWLGGFLASSALALGAAQLLLLSLLLGEAAAAALLRIALAVLLVLHLIPTGLLLAELRSASVDHRRSWLTSAAVVEVVGGTLLPLVLVLAGGNLFALVLAAVLIIVASLVFRFDLVQVPHSLGRPTA